MRHKTISASLLYAAVWLSSCAASKGTPASETSAQAAPPETPAGPPLRPFPEEVQRGICYAHAWLKPAAGYGTPTDTDTLARLKALGVDWVSITPFGFQRDRYSTKLGTSANYKDGESDERVAATAEAAHKLGMKVLLKPHLWVGDNSWCGAITPRDWAAWF